jgi:hypothetical protein
MKSYTLWLSRHEQAQEQEYQWANCPTRKESIMNSRYTALIGILLLCGAMAPGSAYAAKAWVYAVPVACGEAVPVDTAAVPGRYASAITATNIYREESRIRARAELTVPERASSDAVRRKLASLSAVTIDCADLANLFTFETDLVPGAYHQGVILLESERRLVVQVQTTVLGVTGGPSLMQQTVEGRHVGRRKGWAHPEDGSVELCHIPPGNHFAAHTIFVDEAAVSTHQGHGDYIRACDY